MKLITYIFLSLLFLTYTTVFAQTGIIPKSKTNFPMRQFTIEPGIGLNPMPCQTLLSATCYNGI